MIHKIHSQKHWHNRRIQIMWEILGMLAAVHVDITTAFDRRGYTKGDFERSRGNPYVFVDGRLPGKYATSSGHCGI